MDEKTTHGIDVSINHIIDVLKNQGPFDGVLGFSQGGIVWRKFHTIVQKIDPASYPKDSFVMPSFFISVGCPVNPNIKAFYKGKAYEQRMTKQYDFPSLHIVGEKDEFI